MSKDLEKSIGKAVFSLRDDRRWTQKELSSKSGVSNVVISRLENGTVPDIRTLFKLAEALNKKLHEIFRIAEQISEIPTTA